MTSRTRRRLIVLALVAALVPSLVLASPKRFYQRPKPSTRQIPATKPSRLTAAQPQYQAQFINRQLANGLAVVILEDHSVPLVTIELAVRNGSFTEPPDLNGLSHLYEHMFFKANRATANKEEYLRQIGQMGITYNGTTREEIVEYYFTTSGPYIETAMRLMRDSVRYPLFDEDEFARERAVVIGEIDRNESNPYYYFDREMKERMFFKYPSRKNPLGNRQTVGSATTALMRLIKERYYVPNNSALVVAGDVSPEQVFRLAESLFGDWPRAEDPFVKHPMAEHPPIPKSEGVILEQDVRNVLIEIGWHGPSVGKDNPGTYAADVFSFILTQPNSRFQRALIDTGLAANVGIGYYTQRNVGPITIIVQTSPDQAKAALRAVYEEISRFNDPSYFTDEQLENAKALLEADDLFSREKLSEYAHTIAFWWSSTGLDYFRDYHANLRKTSRADISRYLTTYILGKPHIAVAIISPQAQLRARLKPEDMIGQ